MNRYRKPSSALTRVGASLSATLFAAALGWAPPAHANLVITPVFDASITGDTNAAAIEAVINSAASFYDSNFTNPINVTIKFQKGSGLGGSSFYVAKARYKNFINHLTAGSSGDATDTTALAHLPNVLNNPLTNDIYLNVKTVNLRALGFTVGPLPGGLDGTISLNTGLTDVGSPGTTGQYSLLAVVEHEIDEVLGLGSDVGGVNFFSDPLAEDLFRYDDAGNRTFAPHACGSEPAAYFSLDGVTRLAQFHNCSDGADYGDWASDPLPAGAVAQVQDAYGSPGTHPSLGLNSPEVVALDAIGFNLVPEPGSLALVLGSIGALWTARRARRQD